MLPRGTTFGKLLVLFFTMGVSAWVTGQTVLLDEDFQAPLLPNGTNAPAFAGWVWLRPGNVKALRSDVSADIPDDAYPSTNQVIQFEWTDAEGYYDTGYHWETGKAFIVTLNASPQSWSGSTDRYIEPSIRQTDGTVLWTASVLMPKYADYGRNPWTAAQTFTFLVRTDDFVTGTLGEEIRLHLDHGGNRGIYIDNVHLTVGDPPEDDTAPTPDPLIWEKAPVAGDYGSITMTSTNATDIALVEYLFTNTVRGTSSGWQSERTWTEGGLSPSMLYTYRVKARDRSPNQNETAWSDPASATTFAEPAGTLVITGFQRPLYANNTLNPQFHGWVLSSGIRAVRADQNSDGTPGSPTLPNQLLKLDQTSHTAMYDLDYAWSKGNVYTWTINASPQEWSGNFDRYLLASLRQQDDAVLWSTTNMLPKYTNTFLHAEWTEAQTFTYTIAARDFTNGTPGQTLRLHITTDGQRGVYIDNVWFKKEPPAQTLLILR